MYIAFLITSRKVIHFAYKAIREMRGNSSGAIFAT